MFSGQFLGVINETEDESVEEFIFEVALEVNFTFHCILLDFNVVIGSIFRFNQNIPQFISFGELVIKILVS